MAGCSRRRWLVLRAGERRTGLTATLMVSAAALTLAAWLYASPPGSSPDDGYHLGSIWCANGYQPGRCLEGVGIGNPDFAIAPAVLSALPCVGGDGRAPATCINGVYERFDGEFRPIPANITGTRASLYYRAANVLVSDDHAAAIARIRGMNAVLALLVVALTAGLAAHDVRRAVVTTWLIASVPLGVFLLTSLNSTAWGLIGLGTFWANTLTAVRPSSPWRRSGAAILAVIGVLMALGARTEAAAHLAVTVIALVALLSSDSRFRMSTIGRLKERPVVASIAILSALAVAIGAFRVSGFSYLLGATSGFERGWERLVARGISNPALTLAAETPQLWTGGLGTWSLGWLDTNMPSAVSVSTTMAFFVLVALGLTGASYGRGAAAAAVLAGMLVLPVGSLLSSGLIVLEQLQARHYLPLLYILLGIALTRSPGQGPLVLGRGLRWSIAGALSIGHATALTININRYTRGLTEFLYIDTNREVAWWWGGLAPSPDIVWGVGSIAFAVGAFATLNLFSEQSSAEGADEAAPRGAVQP